MHIKIAIDGPCGAGKTTQAKILARKLGYLYVDTGAIYRAFAIHAKALGGDGKSLPEQALETFNVRLAHSINGNQLVQLNGSDVTELLRTPEISASASALSAIPAVREKVLEVEREMMEENNVVMEGRDIGTVVMPDADVKFYLTADLLVRAHRRIKELYSGEIPTEDVIQMVRAMADRDYADSHRAVAPLKQAEDAMFIDCSETDIKGTAEWMYDLTCRKLLAKL